MSSQALTCAPEQMMFVLVALQAAHVSAQRSLRTRPGINVYGRAGNMFLIYTQMDPFYAQTSCF